MGNSGGTDEGRSPPCGSSLRSDGGVAERIEENDDASAFLEKRRYNDPARAYKRTLKSKVPLTEDEKELAGIFACEIKFLLNGDYVNTCQNVFFGFVSRSLWSKLIGSRG